jgi:CheY-like chemotaxis protein
MKSQINQKAQSLSVTLPDSTLLIHADPVRIEQCISNLLSNASKFTDPHGRIALTVSRIQDMAEIKVSDSGAGIEPAMLDRIFEPFLQAEMGRRGGEGLGIGLSLVKRLVELQDGTVRAKSDGVGRGSEFVVCLPLAKAEHTITTTTVTDEYHSIPSDYRVLVVDDNEAAAETIASLLELKAGFQTARAYTGTEAKSIYKDFRPDAIVLDIGLPDTDGYEVARTLRSECGFVGPIIALTGYGQEEDKRKAFAAGFDHHFTKPVGIDEIIAVCGK